MDLAEQLLGDHAFLDRRHVLFLGFYLQGGFGGGAVGACAVEVLGVEETGLFEQGVGGLLHGLAPAGLVEQLVPRGLSHRPEQPRV